MKIKWPTVVLLLLPFFSVQGQDFNSIGIVLKATPLRLFNPSVPAIQLGVELQLSKRVSFSFEYGYPFEGLSAEKVIDIYDKKLEWKYAVYTTEIKYKLPSSKLRRHPFISAQQFVIPQTYSKTSSFLITNGEIITYSESKVEKHVIGFSLNMGTETTFNKFMMEAFVGLGIKGISIDHSLRNPSINPVATSSSELKPWQDDIDRREGIFIRPHAVIGLRFGFGIVSPKE